MQFTYYGLDDVVRETRLNFYPQPARILAKAPTSRWTFSRAPRHFFIWTFAVNVGCECRPPRSYKQALSETKSLHERIDAHRCRVTSSNERFNEWLGRSESDLELMTVGNPEGPYPYAGVPWFNTVFGRDGLITAFEVLWAEPAVAKGVLQFLAETQADSVIPEQDAEPGKIIHELRKGEMAALKEIPFGRYYGSVDSTPLFVMLAAAYYERTGDLEFINSIWSNLQRALDWMDRYGDVDGDGFLEYARHSGTGLIQQGWKDSHDSVFHEDGTLAEAPIALCEVQGYAYAARKGAAKLARAQGLMTWRSTYRSRQGPEGTIRRGFLG